MTKAAIVREFIATMPTASTNAIAKALFKKYPLLFSSKEVARDNVRRQRGEKRLGGKSPNRIKDPMPRTTFTRENPYGLPESHAEERTPFILPKACDNILVLPDQHIPYHDIKANNTAIKYGKENKVNCIILSGDVLDFSVYGNYAKDPRKRSPVQEISAAVEYLTILRKTFPRIPIYWIKGNHDVRYERFLMSAAPMLYEDSYYSLEDRLGLAKLKIKIFDDKTIIKAGKLNILHGHTIFKMSPKNPAEAMLNRFPSASILIGHTHKITTATVNNFDRDSIYTCFSMGCLCELRPDYDSANVKNSHGFAHILVKPNGYFNVSNYRLKDGRIL